MYYQVAGKMLSLMHHFFVCFSFIDRKTFYLLFPFLYFYQIRYCNIDI